MENNEARHEQVTRQPEQDVLQYRQRLEANRMAELRRAADQQSIRRAATGTHRVISSKNQEKLGSEQDVKPSKSNAVQETLIKKIQEPSETEKRAWNKRQMERVRLMPDEIANLRTAVTKEISENLDNQREEFHKRNHHEFMQQFSSNNVEFNDPIQKNVSTKDIILPGNIDDQWNERNLGFWHHHGNTPEFYESMAEKYKNINELFSKGESLDKIKLNPELRLATEFWWSTTDPIKLIAYKNSYFVDEGVHRVALAKKHGLSEIPALVNETQLKRIHSVILGEDIMRRK